MTDRKPPVVKFPRTGRRCPICDKPALVEMAPFCSRRCAQVDLSRWLGEAYAIPGDEVLSPEALSEGESPLDKDP